MDIQPLSHAIPLLSDTPPLDASDRACMDDIRTVLAAHGKLGRFALHLAHKHFDMAPGEAMVERPDPLTRTQHVSVERLADVPDAVPTTWMFMAGEGDVYCVCAPNPIGDGCVGHKRGPKPHRLEDEVKKPGRRHYDHDHEEEAGY